MERDQCFAEKKLEIINRGMQLDLDLLVQLHCNGPIHLTRGHVYLSKERKKERKIEGKSSRVGTLLKSLAL